MSIKELEKEKMELFMLFTMTQALKKTADSASYTRAEPIYNQYGNLRDRLISIDPEARNLVPKVTHTSYLRGPFGKNKDCNRPDGYLFNCKGFSDAC